MLTTRESGNCDCIAFFNKFVSTKSILLENMNEIANSTPYLCPGKAGGRNGTIAGGCCMSSFVPGCVVSNIGTMTNVAAIAPTIAILVLFRFGVNLGFV